MTTCSSFKEKKQPKGIAFHHIQDILDGEGEKFWTFASIQCPCSLFRSRIEAEGLKRCDLTTYPWVETKMRNPSSTVNQGWNISHHPQTNDSAKQEGPKSCDRAIFYQALLKCNEPVFVLLRGKQEWE